MLNDEYIINKFYIKDNRCGYRISGKATAKINEEEYEYLKNRYNDSLSIKETIQRIYYKIEEKNKCPICGKPVLWLGKQKRLMLNTCSLECGFKLRTQHIKETCLEKYGVENCYQSKEKKQKIKETLIKRYGVDNAQKSQEIKKKTEQTCLERYGHKNFGCGAEAKRKIKQTKLEKYGDENYVNTNKIKQTKLERYGDENYQNLEKHKQTCLKHWGVNWYTQSKEHKERLPIINEKRRKTLKEHGILVYSKAESIIYNLLRKKFKKIICQYYSELYPFMCDFYIPEIDTYIEYQGYYTHGNHPFNTNDINDSNELNKLIDLDKNHKTPKKNLYYIKIKVWTECDVKKRNIAKQNKINYIEFYNIDECKKWINEYDEKNY